MSETVLKVANVTKRFGGLQALGGVGIEIKRGQVYGLIGPNGAGKTTLLKLIMGELQPDNGQVRQGAHAHAARRLQFGQAHAQHRLQLPDRMRAGPMKGEVCWNRPSRATLDSKSYARDSAPPTERPCQASGGSALPRGSSWARPCKSAA